MQLAICVWQLANRAKYEIGCQPDIYRSKCFIKLLSFQTVQILVVVQDLFYVSQLLLLFLRVIVASCFYCHQDTKTPRCTKIYPPYSISALRVVRK
jgi:hypothetical protein